MDATRRLQGPDALKGAGILAVVAVHCVTARPITVPAVPAAVLVGLLGFCVPAFMVVAVVFAAGEVHRRGPRGALARRLPRLVAVYAAWTAIYVGFAAACGGDAWHHVRHVPLTTLVLFGGSWPHMYFLPALVQLLVLLPLLLPLARRRGPAVVVVAVGSVAIGAVGMLATHPGVAVAGDDRYAVVWLPYAVAAAALATGALPARRPAVWCAAGIVLVVAQAVALARTPVPYPTAYARAGFVPLAVGLSAWALRRPTAPALLVRVGRSSLGIYLMHWIPLYVWLRLTHAQRQTPLEVVAAFVVTVAVTVTLEAVLRRTPLRVLLGERALRPRSPRVTPVAALSRG